MSKDSETGALPEVDGNDIDGVSEVRDFLKSSDWQQMLENARIEREKNLAARAQGTEVPAPSPSEPPTREVATTAESRPSPKTWLDRIEEARHQREAVMAQREGESAEALLKPLDEAPIDGLSNRVTGKSRNSAETPEPEAPETVALDLSSYTEPEEDRDTVQPKLPGVTRPIDEDDDTAPHEPSQGTVDVVPGDAGNSALSRKLQRSFNKQDTGGRFGFGAIALGCAIGMAATTAVFFVASDWTFPNLSEGASTAPSGPVIASAPSPQSTVIQSPAPVLSGAPSLSDNSPGSLTGLPDVSVQPGLPAVSISEPDQLALLPPPIPQPTQQSDFVDVFVLPGIPSLQAGVSSLKPAPATTSLGDLSPRQETRAHFAQFEAGPLVRDNAPVHAFVSAREMQGNWDIFETAAPAAPIAATRLVALTPENPFVSGVEPAALPTRVLAIGPQASGTGVSTAFSELHTGETVASVDFYELPDLTFSVDPVPRPVQASLPEPEETVEETALAEDVPEQPVQRPLTRPEEDQELPLEAVAASVDEGAEYRLFAPNRVSDGAVQAVVSELESTGHQLSGTARVGFGVTQTNVRFYHPQDAAKAQALAEDAGALLRDFTGARSKTPEGIIELWLAGESSARARSGATRATRNTSPAAQAQRLRSQVLNKLKSATNQ